MKTRQFAVFQRPKKWVDFKYFVLIYLQYTYESCYDVSASYNLLPIKKTLLLTLGQWRFKTITLSNSILLITDQHICYVYVGLLIIYGYILLCITCD